MRRRWVDAFVVGASFLGLLVAGLAHAQEPPTHVSLVVDEQGWHVEWVLEPNVTRAFMDIQLPAELGVPDVPTNCMTQAGPPLRLGCQEHAPDQNGMSFRIPLSGGEDLGPGQELCSPWVSGVDYSDGSFTDYEGETCGMVPVAQQDPDPPAEDPVADPGDQPDVADPGDQPDVADPGDQPDVADPGDQPVADDEADESVDPQPVAAASRLRESAPVLVALGVVSTLAGLVLLRPSGSPDSGLTQLAVERDWAMLLDREDGIQETIRAQVTAIGEKVADTVSAFAEQSAEFTANYRRALTGTNDLAAAKGAAERLAFIGFLVDIGVLLASLSKLTVKSGRWLFARVWPKAGVRVADDAAKAADEVFGRALNLGQDTRIPMPADLPDPPAWFARFDGTAGDFWLLSQYADEVGVDLAEVMNNLQKYVDELGVAVRGSGRHGITDAAVTAREVLQVLVVRKRGFHLLPDDVHFLFMAASHPTSNLRPDQLKRIFDLADAAGPNFVDDVLAKAVDAVTLLDEQQGMVNAVSPLRAKDLERIRLILQSDELRRIADGTLPPTVGETASISIGEGAAVNVFIPPAPAVSAATGAAGQAAGSMGDVGHVTEIADPGGFRWLAEKMNRVPPTLLEDLPELLEDTLPPGGSAIGFRPPNWSTQIIDYPGGLPWLGPVRPPNFVTEIVTNPGGIRPPIDSFSDLAALPPMTRAPATPRFVNEIGQLLKQIAHGVTDGVQVVDEVNGLLSNRVIAQQPGVVNNITSLYVDTPELVIVPFHDPDRVLLRVTIEANGDLTLVPGLLGEVPGTLLAAPKPPPRTNMLQAEIDELREHLDHVISTMPETAGNYENLLDEVGPDVSGDFWIPFHTFEGGSAEARFGWAFVNLMFNTGPTAAGLWSTLQTADVIEDVRQDWGEELALMTAHATRAHKLVSEVDDDLYVMTEMLKYHMGDLRNLLGEMERFVEDHPGFAVEHPDALDERRNHIEQKLYDLQVLLDDVRRFNGVAAHLEGTLGALLHNPDGTPRDELALLDPHALSQLAGGLLQLMQQAGILLGMAPAPKRRLTEEEARRHLEYLEERNAWFDEHQDDPGGMTEEERRLFDDQPPGPGDDE